MPGHILFEKHVYGTGLKDLRSGDYDFKVTTEALKFVPWWPEMTCEVLVNVIYRYCQLPFVSEYILHVCLMSNDSASIVRI